MILLVAVTAILSAFSQERTITIQDEVSRLEQERFHGKLSAPLKTRLAEIYFLTSRCDDVRVLLERAEKKKKHSDSDTLLLCACGGHCSKSSDDGKVSRLRGLLEKGVSWSDPRVKGLWKTVSQIPEAQYWALKMLRASRDPKVRTVRADLEQSLESLEVK